VKNFNKQYYKIPLYSLSTLIKESDYFFNWYLPLIFNEKKVKYMKKKYRSKLNGIYRKLKLNNSFFVHRDFHISNLMYYRNKIRIIDSQDALIGNPAYDIASLVDDVRIKIPINLKKKILGFYLKNCEKKIRLNIKDFINDFNILSVQRNFKILGIFSRLFKRDKKKKYLKLLSYTWKLLDLRMKNNKHFNNLYRELNMDISNKIKNKRFNEN
jgi:aminoglycoside/choline kinase family phosphotransferase